MPYTVLREFEQMTESMSPPMTAFLIWHMHRKLVADEELSEAAPYLEKALKILIERDESIAAFVNAWSITH